MFGCSVAFGTYVPPQGTPMALVCVYGSVALTTLSRALTKERATVSHCTDRRDGSADYQGLLLGARSHGCPWGRGGGFGKPGRPLPLETSTKTSTDIARFHTLAPVA
ncbi:hypothetical protein MRX96_009058 [Rhipicephalus microplus]